MFRRILLILLTPFTFISAQITSFSEEGNWIPEVTSLFPTMLASPRIIGYSAGWRSYDPVFKSSLLPVSLGDRFTIYQFRDLMYGHLSLGIEAGVWAIFEAKPSSLALINADYYIGIPFTYIYDRFALRFRIWHESSHLGDELLIENKHIKRLNPSAEAIDLYLAYELLDGFTLFGGVGSVIRSDKSYKVKPWYLVSGFNYFLNCLKITVANLEATPYLGLYLCNAEYHDWRCDTTVTIGYQWDKSYGHKLRLYLEGHKGFSNDGQFSKQKTEYLALKLIYGY